MGVGSGGQGGRGPPWIFKYGTNIVDKSLKVLFLGLFLLFFGLFFRWPPLKETNSAIFLLIFGLFSVGSPPGKFSADNLGYKKYYYALHGFIFIKWTRRDLELKLLQNKFYSHQVLIKF